MVNEQRIINICWEANVLLLFKLAWIGSLILIIETMTAKELESKNQLVCKLKDLANMPNGRVLPYNLRRCGFNPIYSGLFLH